MISIKTRVVWIVLYMTIESKLNITVVNIDYNNYRKFASKIRSQN